MSETPDLNTIRFHLRKPLYKYHQHQGHSNNCAPTSLSIAANTLLGVERFRGPVVAEEMNRVAFEMRPLPHLVVRRVPNWATFPWGVVHYLRTHNFRAKWHLRGTIENLVHNLETDQITIVIGGEPFLIKDRRFKSWSHAKLLFGYTPGKGFLFVDPAHQKNPSSSDPWRRYGLSWQPEQEYLELWRKMGRIYIEVG